MKTTSTTTAEFLLSMSTDGWTLSRRRQTYAFFQIFSKQEIQFFFLILITTPISDILFGGCWTKKNTKAIHFLLLSSGWERHGAYPYLIRALLQVDGRNLQNALYVSSKLALPLKAYLKAKMMQQIQIEIEDKFESSKFSSRGFKLFYHFSFHLKGKKSIFKRINTKETETSCAIMTTFEIIIGPK